MLGTNWHTNVLKTNTLLEETATDLYNGAATSKDYTVYWNGSCTRNAGHIYGNGISAPEWSISGTENPLYVRYPYREYESEPVWGGEDYGWVKRTITEYTYQYLRVCDSATITYQMYRTACNSSTNTIKIFGNITLKNYNPTVYKDSETEYDVEIDPSTYCPTHIGITAIGITYREGGESSVSPVTFVKVPITIQ